MEHHDHLHTDGAARVLESIRSGADHLIVITRQRVGAALDALDAGDFARVVTHLSDALGCVQPLWEAERSIAIADGSRLVKAEDLTVGMELVNLGPVSEVEVEDCGKAFCNRHVTVKVGGHEMELRGEQEMYVSEESAAEAA